MSNKVKEIDIKNQTYYFLIYHQYGKLQNYKITNKIKMLYYDRIDVSEGTDVNKTSASKECDICHYWYFSNFSFKFQPNVCNRCHDLLMMSVNLSDIAILSIKGFDY